MSCTCSQSELAAAAAASSHQQQLDDVAEWIATGVEEANIVQVLSHLSQLHANLEEWSHSSSHLNLLQLAVLHGRVHVIEYLHGQHRNLMKKNLYREDRTSLQRNAICSHCLKTRSHHVNQPASRDQPPALMTPQRKSEEQLSRDMLENGSIPPIENTSDESSLRQQLVQASMKETEENGPYEGKLVNHPLHMACWLGNLDSLKALTKVVVNRIHRKKLCLQSSGSDAADGQAIIAHMQLQALMKTVSVITSDVSASEEPVEGLPLELAVNCGSISCVTFMLCNILWHWVSSQYYFLCMELKRRAVTLHLACCFSAPKLVAMLLSSLPKDVVHCRDSQGQTPLHFAVWSGDTDTIRLLLDHGADVNAQTSTNSTCLHILFRSKLMPCTMEANTRLLLEYGADHAAPDRSLDSRTLTPLHVLVDEIMQASKACLVMYKRKSAECLAIYARSKWETEPSWSLSDYMGGLVSCLRLLLQAGADPCVLDGLGPLGNNALQVVLSSERYFVAKQCPDVLFSVVSSLLEFGAPVAQGDDCGSVDQFLCKQIPSIGDGAVQASFVRLLSESGVDPDRMGQSLLGSLQAGDLPLAALGLPFWTCLASRMSLGALPLLTTIFSLGQSQQFGWDSDMVLSSLCGSPVRSLRHSCKVAVWKCLRHRGAGVDSLCVPSLVKLYLKSDDL